MQTKGAEKSLVLESMREQLEWIYLFQHEATISCMWTADFTLSLDECGLLQSACLSVHWNISKTCQNFTIFSEVMLTLPQWYTHTHPFDGPLSRTTWVSKRQWQWHQLRHMQICTSLQTNNHASTLPLSFYRPDALPAAQPTVSKHWKHFFLNDNAMLSTSYFVHYHSVCHPGGGDTLIHHGHCWGIMHGLPAADKCCNAWQVGR